MLRFQCLKEANMTTSYNQYIFKERHMVYYIFITFLKCICYDIGFAIIRNTNNIVCLAKISFGYAIRQFTMKCISISHLTYAACQLCQHLCHNEGILHYFCANDIQCTFHCTLLNICGF